MDIDDSITKIEQEKMVPISDEAIKEIFSVLKSHDSDLSVILDIIQRLIMEVDDQNKKTLITTKILKFYGINNNDILSTRQRFIIEDGTLVKMPFLKNKQKELLQMLLDQLEVKVL
jgi:transcriptional regulator with PAS, ATPase and Fis domain